MSTAAPAATNRLPQPRSFGPLLLRVHFYAGLIVAPFLLVAALTGLVYAFTPQIERAYYAHELVIDHPGGDTKTLSAQVAAARAAHPAGDLTAIRPGEGETTTQVDFTSPGLDEEHFHTVYVNQYTGAVTGQLTTWWATTPLKTWFDDLHRNLHLGVAGRYYSEFAASWLWVITVGGVFLWWRRQRGNRTGRKLLAPELAAKKGVRRTRGWHAAVGMWLTVGLLLLSATGLTWSRFAGGNFSDVLDSLRSTTPSVSTELVGGPAPTPTGHHQAAAPAGDGTVDPAAVDVVVRVAREAGIAGPVAVTVPGDGLTAWTVTQTRNLWPVGRDSVAVDPVIGKVVDRVNFADWPVLAKLTRWGINGHMGTLFGLVNQLLLAALAVGLSCVIIWGYRMWWQRRPTRAGQAALVGAPPVGRGAWQQLPTWGVVVGVPVVFALGWFLPLFGVPLAAFLLVDVALGTVRTRPTGGSPVPVSPAPVDNATSLS